jgi:hypothetical protein
MDQKTSVNAAKKITAASTQAHLKIAEIKEDILVLKNGGLRAVLKTSSINFNLKSEAEQNAIIYSYQNFLNTLEFPIQILVRSKKLDIDDYLDKLHKIGEKQTNLLLQNQTFEYVQYIKGLIEYADIMTKEFFVIVPYDPFRAQKPGIFTRLMQNLQPKDSVSEIKRRKGEFEQVKKGIIQRISTITSGLENCGLKVNQLTTKELIELFYNIYNPLSSRFQKLKDSEKMDVKPIEDIV